VHTHMTNYNPLIQTISKFTARGIFSVAMLTSLILGSSTFAAYQFLNPSEPATVAEAAIEPTCNNRTVPAGQAAYNQFPKQTDFPNPVFDAGDCFDMPTLTFFNASDLSTRTRTVTPNSTFTLQMYYSNSGAPNGPAIADPQAFIEATLSGNTYNFKGILEGSTNYSTVTGATADQDGDLQVTVPTGYGLNYVNQAQWYPQAIIRKEIADGVPAWVDPANPSVDNPLNPSAGMAPNDGINAANLFRTFDGLNGFTPAGGINLDYQDEPSQLTNNPPSDPSFYPAGIDANTLYPDGVRDANTPDELPAGFLDYGYILVTLQVVPQTVTGAPNIIIDKSAETTAGVNIPDDTVLTRGDEYVYRLRFRNNGTLPATGVLITDQLDTSRLEYVDNTCSVPANFTCFVANGVVTVEYDNNLAFDPSNDFTEVTFNVRVLDGAPSGNILNSAIAEWEQSPTGTTSNETRHVLEDPQTTLDITKSADPVSGSDVEPGDTITYTLNVDNTGSSQATGVTVTDVLDSNLNYVDGSCGGATCNYDTNTRTITWDVGTLDAGSDIDLTFETVVADNVTAGTQIFNTATVTADNAPDDTSNQTVHTVVEPDPADLQINKSIENNLTSVEQGETYTYTLDVRNIGNSVATNVVITDTLDPDSTYVDGSCTTTNLPTGATCSHTGGVITWTGFDLPANMTDFLTVEYQVTISDTASGTIRNVAEVVADNDPDGDQDEVIVDVIATQANLQINKIIDGNPTSVQPGDVVGYTLAFRNTGNRAADDTVITDVLDPDVTYVDGSCSVPASLTGATCSHANGIITWNLGTLPESMTDFLTVTYSVTVNQGANGNIQNVARITSPDDPDGDEDNEDVPVVDPQANLQINKIIDGNPTSVEPGDTVDYTLEIRNTGAAIATDVVVRDFLDLDATYVDASCTVTNLPTGATCSHTNGVITWTGFDLPANMQTPLIVTYQVTINDDANGTIENLAQITSPDDPDGDEDNEDVPVVDPQANLQINKIIDGNLTSVQPGDVVDYTLEIRNTGAAIATDVVVRDFLDLDATYVDASCTVTNLPTGATCSHTNGVITWTGFDLPANMQTPLIVTYQVTINDDANGTIENLAQITSPDDPDGDEDNEDVPVVSNQPLLQIQKQVENNRTEVSPGETVGYTLSVRNAGPGIAINTVITDTLDPDSTYVDGSCTTTNLPTGATCSHTGGVITWTGFDLPANMTDFLTVEYQVTISDTASGTIRNVAEVVADNDPDGDQDEETVTVLDADVILQIEKSASVSEIEVGGNPAISYTLMYRNAGTTTANNVVIRDVLDPQVSYVTGSCTVPSGGTCSETAAGSGIIEWNIPTLAPSNAFEMVTYEVLAEPTIQAGDVIENVVRITADEDPNGDQDDEQVIVVAPPAPVIDITKSVDVGNGTTVEPGDTLVYTVTVSNTGNTDIFDLVVNDTLDANLTFVDCSDNCAIAGQDVQWVISNLPAGDTWDLTVEVRVNDDASGTIRNVATIECPVSNPDCCDSGDCDSNEIENPIDDAVTLQINKSIENNLTSVEQGETYTYTLEVRNIGNIPATNVVITDTLDTQTTYVDASCTVTNLPTGATCSHTGGVITWTGFDLPANMTDFLTVEYQVTINADATGEIRNVVTVVSDEDPTGDTDEVTVVVDVPVGPQISVVKSVSVGNGTNVVRGQEFAYTLVVTNNGDEDAVSIVINDTLDANLTFVSCDNGCTTSGQLVSWNIPSLPVGQSVALNLVVRVNDDATGTIRNTATVECPTGDVTCCPPSGCNSNEIFNPVDDTELVINKLISDGDGIVNRNQTVTYTLTYANNSNVVQTNVVIVDTLPAQVTFVDGSCLPVCVYDDAARTVTWNLGTLSGGVSGQASFDAVVNSDATGTIRNVGVITSDQDGPEQAENNVTAGGSVIDDTPRTGGFPTGLVASVMVLPMIVGLALYQYSLKLRGAFRISRFSQQ
jgi:uncharacterized repeat protein (TIGR01451 family)